MKTSQFFKKNGNLSSTRHTLKIGGNSITYSSSANGSSQGTTYNTSHTSVRIGTNGKIIDAGFGRAGHYSYFRKNGFSNHIRGY